MVEQRVDRRGERAQRETIAWCEKSPAPNTTATNSWTSSAASEPRPASRTSRSAPLGRCTPCRLAGSVAASLAITRSPGCRRSAKPDRAR
ncbi:MAG: hypothetical protein AUH72_20880 [Acidobacteria bacterium 13_1_40CM_4_65_8]|nr:MAG: hypothetical protein AUH72_20880 [Acidobacteria bacterium 13_1_40CM_4_65_8]